MKKSVIAVLTATVIILAFLGPALYTAQAVDPAAWYTTVNGVLDSDYYVLYPFAAKSLKVGFSKFGELIGIPPGLDQTVQANWVGLDYDGRDPFCPPDTIPMTSWINGWYIDIEYIDPALSGSKRDRHLWAFAMFADGFGWGGDWVWARLPGDEPHGGRKTNGTCVTDPLTVLYNGPRRFVAMSVTHISDKEGATTWPVVDVTITMIFDKVKKEVVLLKDVKLKIPKMHLWDKLDVEFSNREEYDLGSKPGYASYAHFYEENGTTCYGPDWHMAKDLLRENVTYFMGNGTQKVFTIPTTTLAAGFIKIWIDGVFQDPSKYTVDWTAKTVTFNVAPPVGSNVEVHYKYVFKESADWDHKYDIAQVIPSDFYYTAWTATWPPVSDYTVDGILRFLDPLLMVNDADMSIEPKQSPLIIGEWDFLMDHATIPQFRCVEVKGVTDGYADAEDANHAPVVGNVICREVYYQLDEVFMPWDLESAVDKDTERWVQFYNVTTTDVSNANAGTSLNITLTHHPVIYSQVWEKYCNFSERVLWSGALKYPIRCVYTKYDYELFVLANGTGYIYIPATKVPAAGTLIKILYSTTNIVEKLFEIHIEAGVLEYKLPHKIDAIEAVVNMTASPPAVIPYPDAYTYNATHITFTNATGYKCRPDDEYKVIYNATLGRYEWITVGRDAHSADSLGSALVSAAFKNKQVEIGIGGMDMGFQELGITSIPYLLHRFSGTAPGWPPNYKDSIYRIALRDDWCKTWPVASSNIIAVGGPLANHITEYFNDFTDAFYGLNTTEAPFTPYTPWIGKVIALTCWNKTTYYASADMGYAVISTYKDINGTVGIVIWGLSARDTFYACYFFDKEIIHELQDFPPCATSIIIEIDYTDKEHPTFTIPQVLGTISETTVEVVKGGIHDP